MKRVVVDTTGLFDGELPDANDALVPVIELKTLFEDLLNGLLAFESINIGNIPAHENTISSNAITPSYTNVILKPETGVSDELDTINGGGVGKFLLFRINLGQTITIRHDVDNIVTATGANIVLSTEGDMAAAIYTGVGLGSNPAVNKWLVAAYTPIQLQARLAASASDVVKFKIPDRTQKDEGQASRRLLFRASHEAGNNLWLRAIPTGIDNQGIAAPTIAHSGSNLYDPDADGAAYRLRTLSTTGNSGGLVSATFNLVRLEWQPGFVVNLKLLRPLGNVRIWIGLCSAGPSNADNVGGSFIGFRYSTAAKDESWTPVLRDGTTQNTGRAMSTIGVDRKYTLSFRVDDDGAHFYVDDEEQILSDNLPDVTTDLGYALRVFTLNARDKRVRFYNLEIEMA